MNVKKREVPSIRKVVLSGILAVALPYAFIFLMGAMAERFFWIYEHTSLVLGFAFLLFVVIITYFCVLLLKYRKVKKTGNLET